MFQLALLIILEGFQAASPECSASDGNFVYPPLAKSARIRGDVTVRVRVNEQGRPVILSLQGHPMLSQNLDKPVAAMQFPVACSGQDIDLKLAYELTDSLGLDRTVSTGANQWLIQTGPVLIDHGAETCIRSSKPWWKRWLHRNPIRATGLCYPGYS